ncbi:uncharacterized protein LOC114746342 [Neltuma alba]|uniref:uncharacterized protein LOC114746342 n=1 Tax=Neltuma alba TaxID=207710 RepID=UPI0010A480E1|nr:uncharacterized protein LOC114746342 [Prosopis alba]
MEKALSQLVELQVLECNSMKRIVLIETENSGISSDEKIEFHSLRSLSLCHLPVIHDFCSNEMTSFMTATSLFNGTKVSFPSLEALKLSSINLEKIWDDQANCIQNLTHLIVEDCRGLKHLFSSFSVRSLSKLKHLEISKCEMMEEIIAPDCLATQEVRFTKLETMVVKDMESLKKVWRLQFASLKSLEVSNCGKLVDIFPSDMLGTLGSLETLTVSSCGSVEEIFESTAKGIHNEDERATQQVSQLKKLHLFGLPKLKHIWSRDAQANLRFHNLQLVRVEDCENLEYLFPFSIAMQATQLEHIIIKYSGRMKHIVSGNEVIPMDSPFTMSIIKGIRCPHVFEIEALQDTRYKTQDRVFDGKQQISMQQPLFTLEEVICNLEELTLNSEDASIILQGQLARKHFRKLKFLYLANFEDDHATFPYWFLQNITTLNELLVEKSSFKEIFREEIPIQDKGKFKIGTRIKSLTLNRLDDLEHICKEGFQIDPVLEELEYLDVDQCSKLKHLVPSSVTFSHLTYLAVENCNGLVHLITSSTARSLVKLTTMNITNCNSLEQVVVAEEREGSENEIAFNSLQILELECLPMIKRFCSSNSVLILPSLVNVVVKQCPRMNIFSMKSASTPSLREIQSKEEDEKMYWEGDINRTINKMFVDMVAFHSFEQLELSQYPELRESWYNLVQQGVFVNLRNLVVQKCDFLSDVLLPLNLVQALSNLEELQVSECESLEVVFDLTNMDRKEVFVKETIPLKRITLSSLPKLKHVWKQNFQETVSFRETTEGQIQHQRRACSIQQVRFPNLQLVCVEHCETVEYLFPLSIAMQATRLERITIKYAGRMKVIVSGKEGLMDSPIKFEFNHLTSLVLWNLYELEGFFAGNHGVLCPVLRELDVRLCVKLKLFKTQKEAEGSEDEIAFGSLQILELECLPMIKRFCSSNCGLNLPSLVNVVVKQCPRMNIFSMKSTSTPTLREIQSMEEDEKMYWEGDLNRTINKMFTDMKFVDKPLEKQNVYV